MTDVERLLSQTADFFQLSLGSLPDTQAELKELIDAGKAPMLMRSLSHTRARLTLVVAQDSGD